MDYALKPVYLGGVDICIFSRQTKQQSDNDTVLERAGGREIALIEGLCTCFRYDRVS